MKRLFINLSGNNGVGKDTVATFMQEYLKAKDITVQILSLAKPVKECLAILTNESVDAYDDRVKKESIVSDLGMSRRDLMKAFTAVMMEVHASIFWKNALGRLERDVEVIIITDYRYQGWTNFLELKGEYFINVHISTTEKYNFPKNAYIGLLGVYEIFNNESLETLKGIVNSLMNDVVQPLFFSRTCKI